MMTGNGVLSLLKYNSRPGTANFALNVHFDSLRRLSRKLIGDNQTPNPPICFPISLLAKGRGWGGEGQQIEARSSPWLVPWSAHVDLWRPNDLAFHQTAKMVKLRIFACFPLHARFTVSDLLSRNQDTRCRAQKCNEAVVFDTSREVPGSCVRERKLFPPSTYLLRPPRSAGSETAGKEAFHPLLLRPGTSQNEIS